MIDRPDGSPDEPRQRWRIVFARDAAVRDPSAGTAAAWEAALTSAGLPIARSLGKSPRPKLTIGAPLPVGTAGEAELADLVLTERLPVADVRARLSGHLPEGHRLVDLFDVWLGAPTLSAQVVAADYRMTVRGASGAELGAACSGLVAATGIERTRQKGDGRAVTYDLRPLILALTVVSAVRTDDDGAADDGAAADGAADDGAADDVRAATGDVGRAATLRMRLRHAGDGPSGRPDEVILALGEALGRPLEPTAIVRERLLTADLLERDATPSG